MAIGTVKFFNAAKGFGFIAPEAAPMQMLICTRFILVLLRRVISSTECRMSPAPISQFFRSGPEYDHHSLQTNLAWVPL